ncbi:hypothetical protein [Dyadobacter luticola]|uniref:Uncharacterized protein n=1 Tax=Dyadobacter luticola TaxID=1979387 RepID=A0A5R9L1F6_9BACT|nr:hypothetical protein [Dyadobacter luticola]TLV02207.1 hypothetical protein FEN17_00775 [Dyadobacter luticola]
MFNVITYLNWLLICFYGSSVVWALVQPVSVSHEMPGVESKIKVVGFLLLIVIIALNLSSYPWAKVASMVLVISMLGIIRWFSDN